MKKVVPFPSSVVKVSVPPCSSTTTDLASANPCPVPLPTSLVVKKRDASAGVADSDYGIVLLAIGPHSDHEVTEAILTRLRGLEPGSVREPLLVLGS